MAVAWGNPPVESPSIGPSLIRPDYSEALKRHTTGKLIQPREANERLNCASSSIVCWTDFRNAGGSMT